MTIVNVEVTKDPVLSSLLCVITCWSHLTHKNVLFMAETFHNCVSRQLHFPIAPIFFYTIANIHYWLRLQERIW